LVHGREILQQLRESELEKEKAAVLVQLEELWDEVAKLTREKESMQLVSM